MDFTAKISSSPKGSTCSSSVDSAAKSSCVVPSPADATEKSTLLSAQKSLLTGMKKRRNGESVDEIIHQWKASNTNNLSVRGGSDGFKCRRNNNLGKGSRKGYMKGKGGPQNLACKFKGVRQRTSGKWVAEIRQPGGGRLVWLGTFATAHDAALAFDKAAIAMYGSFAKLNIPDTLNSPPEDLDSGELSCVDTELRLGVPK